MIKSIIKKRFSVSYLEKNTNIGTLERFLNAFADPKITESNQSVLCVKWDLHESVEAAVLVGQVA